MCVAIMLLATKPLRRVTERLVSGHGDSPVLYHAVVAGASAGLTCAAQRFM